MTMQEEETTNGNRMPYIIPLPLRALNPHGIFLDAYPTVPVPLATLSGSAVTCIHGGTQRLESLHPDLKETLGIQWKYLDRVSIAQKSKGERFLILFSGLSLPVADILTLPLRPWKTGETEGGPFTLLLLRMLQRNFLSGVTEIGEDDIPLLGLRRRPVEAD